MTYRSADGLPAAAIADEVNSALAKCPGLVITAPPGAGKSTLLPLTILEGLGGGARILMLEPRRLAARQIAERMASMLGEPVGRTVGYRIRFESRVSASTRIEVLTEGILTRMLLDDPALDGVSAVIFDEFHERSLASDTALALTRESQSLLRPDLKIVIMSATIDVSGICPVLGFPSVTGEGRSFPVEIINSREDADILSPAEAVVRTIRQAHREKEGDILAFLPGEADIRQCEKMLGDSLGSTRVRPLYGMLPFDRQREAIAPSAPGERKVVLATSIAETSLTIEGVRVVVDSGLCRKQVFNPQNSLSHLETVRISRDMADQRAGRAGRVAPGTCYRLWSLATDHRMPGSRIPEILEADLAATVLSAAAWGESRPERLPWLTPPPQTKVAGAQRLLSLLGALDDGCRATAHGRALAALPCHPRIAGMLLKAGTPELKALAADIAALLEEKDPMQSGGASVAIRIGELRRLRSMKRQGGPWGRIMKIAEQYRSMVRVPEDNSFPDPFDIGALLAAAYPERIAKAAAEGCGHFILASGDPAAVDRSDEICAYEWIVVASLNALSGGTGRIFLASPVHPSDIMPYTRERDTVTWDSKRGAVSARHERCAGCLTVDSHPINGEVGDRILQVLCDAARKEGRSMFDFSDAVQNLQRRVAAVASWHPELGLPDLGTDAVLDRVGEWLPFYAGKSTTAAELKKIDLETVLWSLLTYDQQQTVESLAPSHITVPSGSRIRVEYRQGADAPVVRVRLQECFGLVDTPRVDGGLRPVLMELLSPGFKPVQLTQDLRSFWEGTYFEVRKELRRRYPKHSWPDNPLEAEATRRTVSGRKP